MLKISIPISGMTCGHCVKAVNSALSNLKGMKQVSVSLESNSASVEFDENILSLGEIKKVISEEGYQA